MKQQIEDIIVIAALKTCYNCIKNIFIMPSSVIAHFSYDAASSALTITFLSGNVYVYQKVPENVYKALKAAGSKGRYFNFYIKDKFRFKHLK